MNLYQKERCLSIINSLIELPISYPFIEMVDPIRDGAPQYYEIITEPMALVEVKRKLKESLYKKINELIHDVNLIWANAKKFNGEDSLFTIMAMEASLWFDKKIKNLPSSPEEEWLMKVQKVTNKFYNALCNPPHDLESNSKNYSHNEHDHKLFSRSNSKSNFSLKSSKL